MTMNITTTTTIATSPHIGSGWNFQHHKLVVRCNWSFGIDSGALQHRVAAHRISILVRVVGIPLVNGNTLEQILIVAPVSVTGSAQMKNWVLLA